MCATMELVLIFSVVLVAVESTTLTDLRVKSAISRDETIKIFPALLKNPKISDVISTEYESIKGSDKKIEQARSLKDFLAAYNESFEQMEDILTTTIFNYVVLQLWTYCTVVISKLDRLTQDAELSVEDLDVISFERNHDYSIINYLFNYKHNVDIMMHTTFFFQSVRFLRSNNLAKQIRFQVNYFKEILKFKNNFDQPGIYDVNQHAGLSDDDLKKKLKLIEKSLSDVAKEFTKIQSLPLITSNLIADPHKIVLAINKIPPIKYYFANERVDLTYEYVNGSESQNMVIAEWKTEKVAKSSKYLEDEYCEAVMSEDQFKSFIGKKTEESQSKASTSSSSGSAGTSASAQSTSVTLNELRDSIKVKNHYLNAVSYTNVNADVFLAHSVKDGIIMLGAVKSLFADPCSSKTSRIDLTLHLIHQMRAQLVTFNHLYDGMKSFMLRKIPYVLKDNSVKDEVFLEKLGETLKLLNIPTDYTVDIAITELCSPLMASLQEFPDAVFGDNYDKRRFVNYYFYNTLLNTYEKFNYTRTMFQL